MDNSTSVGPRRQVHRFRSAFARSCAVIVAALAGATAVTLPASPAAAGTVCVSTVPGYGCEATNNSSYGIYVTDNFPCNTNDTSCTKAREGLPDDPYGWPAHRWTLGPGQNTHDQLGISDTDAFYVPSGCIGDGYIATYGLEYVSLPDGSFTFRGVEVSRESFYYYRWYEPKGIWRKFRDDQEAFISRVTCGGPGTPENAPHVNQSAPPVVGITGRTTSTISLSWTWKSGMDYDVFRNGLRIGNGGGSYTDGGLAASTSYTYMVREIDEYGGKVTSVPVTATTLAGPGGGGGGGGTPSPKPFVAAFQANTSGLLSTGTYGYRDWGQGMAAGTSPSVARLAGGGIEVAFQANNTQLITVGDAAWTNWGLGMMPGTSPSITGLTDGGWQLAFQANTGNLWTIGTAGWRDWGLGMKAGTSPSITALPNGGWQVAFQANTSNLWTVGTAGNTDWGYGMMAGTNPSITSPSGGGFMVAFQANTGSLYVAGTYGSWDWEQGMAPATSPSITSVPNGVEIAFQANTTELITVGNAGWTNWGLGMMPGTSPSIVGLSGGGFEVAFQANSSSLWVIGDGGWTNTGLGMRAGTSPAIARH